MGKLARTRKLVPDLQESIVEDDERGSQGPVSPKERELLTQRLAEDDAAPDDAVPWAEARVKLLHGR